MYSSNPGLWQQKVRLNQVVNIHSHNYNMCFILYYFFYRKNLKHHLQILPQMLKSPVMLLLHLHIMKDHDHTMTHLHYDSLVNMQSHIRWEIQQGHTHMVQCRQAWTLFLRTGSLCIHQGPEKGKTILALFLKKRQITSG